MTVYFARPLNNPSEIKIGSTERLADRMNNLAAQFGPLELVAKLSGGSVMERLLHDRFSVSRLEGEWFSATDEIMDFIATQATAVGEVYEPKQRGQRPADRAKGTVRDQIVAGNLLVLLTDQYPPSVLRAQAQEEVFKRLREKNSSWTRRRVRSIAERRARRVEMTEVIDLLEVAEVPRAEWADCLTSGWIRSAPTLASRAA